MKPIRIRRIKYQPLEQTTGTDSDKASRGKGEEAGVEEEEDGRKEAIEEGIGLLEGTSGVDMARVYILGRKFFKRKTFFQLPVSIK